MNNTHYYLDKQQMSIQDGQTSINFGAKFIEIVRLAGIIK